MQTTTTTFTEWVSTSEYDLAAIGKFRKQQIRKAINQNKKVAASPKLQKSFSIIDPEKTADFMVDMYKHHFLIRTPQTISK